MSDCLHTKDVRQQRLPLSPTSRFIRNLSSMRLICIAGWLIMGMISTARHENDTKMTTKKHESHQFLISFNQFQSILENDMKMTRKWPKNDQFLIYFKQFQSVYENDTKMTRKRHDDDKKNTNFWLITNNFGHKHDSKMTQNWHENDTKMTRKIPVFD